MAAAISVVRLVRPRAPGSSLGKSSRAADHRLRAPKGARNVRAAYRTDRASPCDRLPGSKLNSQGALAMVRERAVGAVMSEVTACGFDEANRGAIAVKGGLPASPRPTALNGV